MREFADMQAGHAMKVQTALYEVAGRGAMFEQIQAEAAKRCAEAHREVRAAKAKLEQLVREALLAGGVDLPKDAPVGVEDANGVPTGRVYVDLPDPPAPAVEIAPAPVTEILSSPPAEAVKPLPVAEILAKPPQE